MFSPNNSAGRLGRLALLLLLLAASCVPSPAALSAAEPSQGEKLFALTVRPMLKEKCFGCHGDEAEKLAGGFDLRSRQAMLEGGDAYGDTVVLPGDSEASALLAMVSREEEGYEMPPKEAERLTQEQVWAIRDWIDADAPWPDEARVAEIYRDYAEGVTVRTSGGLDPQWTNRKYKPEDLWAFQPIRTDFRIDLDSDDDGANPVDRFIDAHMREMGVKAAPPADRATLIRRATFDLLGLPPTPEEVRHFVSDSRDDRAALAALVDRLLESELYGQQWARHWMDVVRYSDSSGFANDWERPNAWRYRDYVVRAFNQDKPFDEFTIEQIAGDELAESAEQRGEPLTESEKTELLIAAGFLRMGPWEHTGMSVAKVTRQLFLDDITDTVGQVFLAQALQCCRCHDHKFDPIPTRDYYSFQAAFATTQFADVDTEWLAGENRSGMEQDRRYHDLRHKQNRQMLRELDQRHEQYEAEWLQQQGLPHNTFAEAKKAGMKADDLPTGRMFAQPEEFGRERIGRKWQTRFSWEYDRYTPIAMTVYNGKTPPAATQASRFKKPSDPMGKGIVEQTAILTGGDPFAPALPVSPGVLSVVPGALGVALPDDVQGRRTALAEWIVGEENSLTARVLVNRVWAFHFGRGIAGNPNNFGATGKKPTHPELLDWLAGQFVRDGWSIKHLHRVIMNSDVYRRSTLHPQPEKLAEDDPAGTSYAVFQPRRLESEELRDAMLMVSGELNLKAGGIPVRPDMNLEAALQPRMIMGTFAPSYIPNPLPQDRNRRSIYIHNLRGHRLPFMETFNQPGSETSCELRDQSNITPQVFTLMNSQETSDRALATAARVLSECDNDQAAVARLFQLAYGRQPSADEASTTLLHWQRMTKVQSSIKPQPAEPPTEVIREAIDENTGRPFQFTEQLFAYEDYVPDLSPRDVDARTRAFADVCLVVINSNEFIYVY
jgi:mono/diheme cytochrome c family protein